jgi:hypothetical protein
MAQKAKELLPLSKFLNSTYKGFNKSLRDTPGGNFVLLANSAERAKVIIGDGLTRAMLAAFGSGDVERATSNMEKFSGVIADVIEGLGIMAGAVINLRVESEPLTSSDFMGVQRGSRTPFDPMAMKAPDLTATFMAEVKRQQKADLLYRRKMIKLEKEALTLEKKKTAELKARAKLEKANRALDMAGTIFDLDKIQLYAALQSKITEEDRDKLNLKLLLLNAENQTGAALSKSAQEATLLSQKILMQNGLVMTYDGLIKNLEKAKNPFEGFDEYLQELLNKMRDLQLAINNINSMGKSVNYQDAFARPNTANSYVPVSSMGKNSDYQDAFARPNTANGFSGTPFGQASSSGSNTTVVNVNASYIANPQEIQDVVQNAIQNANRAGNSTNYAGQLGF